MTSTSSPQASPVRFVRPELRRLKAYHLDQGAFTTFKLDQNEVPFDLPRRLKEDAIERLRKESWSIYPTFNGDEFRKALSSYADWPWEGILVGSGSSELLSLSVESMCPPLGEVLGHVPSFGLYMMLVPRSGGTPKFLPAGPDLKIPFDDLLEEIKKDPSRPLILCSPNNPAGDALSVEQVETLLQHMDAPLLLDNAYHEFSQYDYRPLLDRYRHLVIYRTLSKAWAVAGIRLGYLLADPDLVAELVKAKLPYNLGHASIATGLAVMAAPGFSRRAVQAILARRPQWQDLLRRAGFEVFDSETNFVLIRCSAGGGGPEAAQERMKKLRDGLGARGILTRDVSAGPGLSGCLRITVGSGGALRATRKALIEMGYLDDGAEGSEV